MTEVPEANLQNKKKYAAIFFEQLNLNCFQTVPDCVLALYAMGKLTGTVMNVGGSLTNVLSIYDGYAVQRSFRYNKLGGMDLTHNLLNKMKDIQDDRSTRSLNYFDAEKIKIEKCFYNVEDKVLDDVETCELPDGSKIDIRRDD